MNFEAVTRTLTAQSTVEAELVAAAYVSEEAVYLSKFLSS